jgi:hypothetical protein
MGFGHGTVQASDLSAGSSSSCCVRVSLFVPVVVAAAPPDSLAVITRAKRECKLVEENVYG